MLTSLKQKLVTASKNAFFKSDEKSSSYVPGVDIDSAGLEILRHFQQEWAQLHALNEENAKQAETVARSISTIHSEINHKLRNIIDINGLVIQTGNIKDSANNCVVQLKQLQSTCETIEKKLIELENLIEVTELERKKFEYAEEKKAQTVQELSGTGIAPFLADTLVEMARQHSEKKHKQISETHPNKTEAIHESGTDSRESQTCSVDDPTRSKATEKLESLEEIQIVSDENELKSFLDDN